MHSLFWTHPTAGSWFIMREILKRRMLIRHCQWNRPLTEILIFLSHEQNLSVWKNNNKKRPTFEFQKQPSSGVLRKRCSENMQQIYRRTPIPKLHFAMGVLLHIFRKHFLKNPFRWVLLEFFKFYGFTSFNRFVNLSFLVKVSCKAWVFALIISVILDK